MSNDKKTEEEPQEAAPQAPEGQAANEDNATPLSDHQELPLSPEEELATELADLKDRYIRLAADMENLRKRTAREKADMAKYAITDFARDILNLSDNFERAIEAVPAEEATQNKAFSTFLEGIKMNESALHKVLERHGVTPINPEGERFDPNMHQAVQQVETKDLPNDTVCDVFQVGYVIADRVLRHAVVSVSKGGPKIANPATSEPEQDEQTEDEINETGSTIDKNV